MRWATEWSRTSRQAPGPTGCDASTVSSREVEERNTMNPTQHRSRSSVAALVAVLALTGSALAACGSEDSAADSADAPAVTTTHTHDHAAQADLQAAMRTLWAQHMEWTWSTVDAFVQESPGPQAQLDRLLRNQKDIGDAIAPYYGDAAAKQLTELLTTHINEAVPVLTAAKAGDDAALKKALDDWYVNAQQIADFLSSANPDSWDKDAVRDMMKTHIDTTVGYATAALGGDYVTAVANFDAAEEHMMHMADTLSAGIIAQFPDRF